MMKVQFTGLENMNVKLTEVQTKMTQMMGKAMGQSVTIVQTAAIKNARKPDARIRMKLYKSPYMKRQLTPAGREWYAEHKGDASSHPVKVTGQLTEGVLAEVQAVSADTVKGIVGVARNVKYAKYVEKRYPFIKPAWDINKNRIFEKFRRFGAVVTGGTEPPEEEKPPRGEG